MPGVPTSIRPKRLAGAASIALALALACLGESAAAPLRISWASGTEADLLGYRLRYGTAPGQYSETLDVGLKTTVEIDTLEVDRTYYFSVYAYDWSGNESPASAEVVAKLPASGAPIPSLETTMEMTTHSIYALRGRSAVFTLYGRNFLPGANVEFGNGVATGAAVRNAAGNLQLIASIAGQAAPGERTVTVTNPDGGIGSRSGALVVVRTPDTNADCHVDAVDLNALARAWNESAGESRYADDIDFDGDGYIGPEDLAIFVQYYPHVFNGCS